MIVPATLFGLIRYHSLWYAVNLLAAGGFVSWAGESNAFLAQFHLLGLLAAFGIHALTSLLVGLLYGAMLPMFPRKPILTAGFIAPFLWTGILYSALGVISPILNARIDWFWFVLSQIAFGLVCGFVVNLQVKVRTPQFRALPFAVRAGIHSDQPHGDPSLLKDEESMSSAPQIRTATLCSRCWLRPAWRLALAAAAFPAGLDLGPKSSRPEEVLDFPALYKQNCAACHGENGRNGAAISLANPVYIALAGEDPSATVIANGVPGKLMPAFAKSAGGMLTDGQVAALAQGICKQWGNPSLLAGQNPPPYLATLPGNAEHGLTGLQVYCARCHGATGEGGPADGNADSSKASSAPSSTHPILRSSATRTCAASSSPAGPTKAMPDWRHAHPARATL